MPGDPQTLAQRELELQGGSSQLGGGSFQSRGAHPSSRGLIPAPALEPEQQLPGKAPQLLLLRRDRHNRSPRQEQPEPLPGLPRARNPEERGFV